MVVTLEKETFLITKTSDFNLSLCNHIEADTRLILEVEKSKNDVVIRSSDTDVLMLMCFIYKGEHLKNNWFMMIDNETFVSINKIREYFGDDVCDILPAYHSITGCDTTSYPANIGKIKPFNKMILTNSMHLLKDFGRHKKSYLDLSTALEFFHKIMYSGKDNESITDTRVRTFTAQKNKTSVNIIPDQASIKQHLLRADLQAFFMVPMHKTNYVHTRCCWPRLVQRKRSYSSSLVYRSTISSGFNKKKMKLS